MVVQRKWKIICALMILCLMFSVPVIKRVHGADELTYGDYTYTISGSSATITGYSGNDSVIVVPSKIEAYSVIGIGKGAFSGHSEITSITLPSNLQTLEVYAFRGTSITSITIPKTITTCTRQYTDYEGPFYGASQLEEVVFEEGLTKIPDHIFSYGDSTSNIKSIKIPSTVTSIGNYAFRGAGGLVDITIPKTITTIGDYAFYNCANLDSLTFENGASGNITLGQSSFASCINLKNISFSDDITSIGQSCFSGCSSITSVALPSNLQTLEVYAFRGTSITSITIPKTITTCTRLYTDYEGPFYGALQLEEVVFEEGLTKIPDYIFSYGDSTSNIKSIKIPSTVTSIGNYAFRGATNLTDITIPKSVTSISSSAFYSCTNLQRVHGYKNSYAESWANDNGYEFVCLTDSHYSETLDEWLTSQGTYNTIKYLSNDANFPCSLAVAKSDDSFGDHLAETLSNMYYRKLDGWKEIFAGSSSREEARNILIALLDGYDADCELVAQAKTADEMAGLCAKTMSNANWAFAVDYGLNSAEIQELSQICTKDKIADFFMDGEYMTISAYLQIKGGYDENSNVVKCMESFMSSKKFADSVCESIDFFSDGMTILDMTNKTAKYIFNLASLAETDEMYSEMLLVIQQNCTYTEIQEAAGDLYNVIHGGYLEKINYASQALKDELDSTVIDKTLDAAAKAIPYGTLVKGTYDFAVGISNTLFKTGDIQQQKDNMRCVAYIGNVLGQWLTDNSYKYMTATNAEKTQYSRITVYSYYMLLKVRLAGEQSFQKMLELSGTSWKAVYPLSKQVEATLVSNEKWIKDLGVLNSISTASVSCPVDVQIYDSNAQLIVTMYDGQESEGYTGDLYYSCAYNPIDNDYIKLFRFPTDSGYTVNCVGKHSGIVDVSVSELTEDGSTTIKNTNNIPVDDSTNININDFNSDQIICSVANEESSEPVNYESHLLSEYVGVTEINSDDTAIKIPNNTELMIPVTVKPDNATNPMLTWISSDESIAAVNSDGLVTALKEGEVTITCTSIDNSSLSKIFEIEVIQNLDYLSFTAIDDSVTIGMNFTGTPAEFTLEYALSKAGPWQTFAVGGSTKTVNPVTLNAGETMYIRNTLGGDNAIKQLSINYVNYVQFTMNGTGTLKSSGNIMSVLDNNCTLDEIESYAFYSLFKNCTLLINTPKLLATTLSDSCYYYMFNGCTGLTSAPELPATTLSDYCYSHMFNGCTGLTSAPELPATTLSDRCYNYMFNGCTGLTSAPELPATTLSDYCYSHMFNGCTGLTSVPELPATTLSVYCYYCMFNDCAGLISAPELPATTLSDGCYSGMFDGCTNLTDAPELPATSLENYCYSFMFSGCTSLIKAPLLPAENLAVGCYNFMFNECISLTSTPELPAMNLSDYCYKGMFNKCTSLTSISELPATDLKEYCYSAMFSACSALKNAPILPATSLSTACYNQMFRDCVALEKAPELNATILADNCYSFMFYGCSKLSSAPKLPSEVLEKECYHCMFTNCSNLLKVTVEFSDWTIDSSATTNWLSGVASIGTFTCPEGLDTSQTGASYVPEGWTVNQTVSVTQITLSSNQIDISVGQEQTLTAEIAPDNATNKNVTWSSSDESIATVNSEGLVTGVKAGQATITCSAKDGSGVSASCVVNIEEKVAVTEIILNEATISLEKGTQYTLTETVKPDNATNKNVLWTSQDESIATVTDGVVTAVSSGTTKVYCKSAENSNIFAICEVIVNEVPAEKELSRARFKQFVDETATAVYFGTEKPVSYDATASVGNGITGYRVGTKYYIVSDTGDAMRFPASCSSFFSNGIKISGFTELEEMTFDNIDTSNVTDMYAMFCDCQALKTLDLSAFDTSNVTAMGYMFAGCKSLETINVSSFDVSKVTSFYDTFYGCKSLKNLDLSNFVTTSAKQFTDMFDGCSSLETLNISSFDSTAVRDTAEAIKNYAMSMMFKDCSSLKTIWVSESFDKNDFGNCTDVFKNCSSLVGGAGTVYDAAHTDITYACIDGGTDNPGYFTAKTEVVKGDINQDGELTLEDAKLAKRIAMKDLTVDYTSINADAGDLDANGVITINEARKIKRAALGVVSLN